MPFISTTTAIAIGLGAAGALGTTAAIKAASGPKAQPASAAPAPVTPAQATKDIQSEADKAAEAARKRAAKAAGRQSTILTSPLGVVDSGASYTKTLLGQ